MKYRRFFTIALFISLIGISTLTESAVVHSATLPVKIGKCTVTKIKYIGPRLQNVQGGTTILYANNGHQVDYAIIPAVNASRVGDSVTLCLISIPENCPPGDNRGRVYSANNLRTKGKWIAPDSQHNCGGA